MKIYISYETSTVGKIILHEQLNKFKLEYSKTNSGEFDLKEPVSNEKMQELSVGLSNYGIEILQNKKSILVQRIKDLVIELVYMEDNQQPACCTSNYLSDKLNYGYAYISQIFSNMTFSTIENFVKLQKIERSKQLILNSDLTVSEIAWKLNYSSTAHFSTQFKNVTGLSPTVFLRIIKKRRELMSEVEYEL